MAIPTYVGKYGHESKRLPPCVPPLPLPYPNGMALVAWTPDLGAARVYVVEGRTNLTDGVWGTTNSGARFFRVNVGMP